MTPAASGLSLHLLKIWPLHCYLIQLFSVGYSSQLVSHSLLAGGWSCGTAKLGTNSDPLYGFSSLSSDKFSALQKHLVSLFLLNLNPLLRHWWLFFIGLKTWRVWLHAVSLQCISVLCWRQQTMAKRNSKTWRAAVTPCRGYQPREGDFVFW